VIAVVVAGAVVVVVARAVATVVVVVAMAMVVIVVAVVTVIVVVVVIVVVIAGVIVVAYCSLGDQVEGVRVTAVARRGTGAERTQPNSHEEFDNHHWPSNLLAAATQGSEGMGISTGSHKGKHWSPGAVETTDEFKETSHPPCVRMGVTTPAQSSHACCCAPSCCCSRSRSRSRLSCAESQGVCGRPRLFPTSNFRPRDDGIIVGRTRGSNGKNGSPRHRHGDSSMLAASAVSGDARDQPLTDTSLAEWVDAIACVPVRWEFHPSTGTGTRPASA